VNRPSVSIKGSLSGLPLRKLKVKKPRPVSWVFGSKFTYGAYFEEGNVAEASVSSTDPKHLRKVAVWLNEAAAWLESKKA
jgi:hypothetical protein